jgi:hypothetical protein
MCLPNRIWAETDHDDIPEQVSGSHWSCKEIESLGSKYTSPIKFPDGEIKRKDLAGSFLIVLEKVLNKYENSENDSISKEDLERITVLHEALKSDLVQFEGYLIKSEEITKLLAAPKEPTFLYKIGMAGFVRGEIARNFSLTDLVNVPGHGEGRLVYRLKPYAYWHPTDWLNIHLEGQGFGFAGGAHQEYNKYSLYQGFIDVKWPGNDILALRGGRQEFSYGSGFILGNDAFGDGLSFDAVKVSVKPVAPLTIDLLAGSYAQPFADGVAGNQAGIYATYSLSAGNEVNAYVFRDTGSENHRPGEKLYIWGGRFTANYGPISAEFEPVYESGRQFSEFTGGNDRIEAYGGHLDLNIESELRGHKNRCFLSYAYGSGSRDAVDGIRFNREFRNPNNYASFLEYISVVGDLSGLDVNGHHASGLQVYTLGWNVDIMSGLNFSATGHYYLANEVENSFSRHLGLETNFTLTWNIQDNFSLILSFDRLFTGGFFRDSGAHGDVTIGYLMAQFDLAHKKLSR